MGKIGLTDTETVSQITDPQLLGIVVVDIGQHFLNDAVCPGFILNRYGAADYLTKKIVRNDGAVPQYYVEDCHEAIIEPETFDRVQEMIEQRSRVGAHWCRKAHAYRTAAE